MDFISRFERNFAVTLEDIKQISHEFHRLISENERLLSDNHILLREKESLTEKLQSTSCPNCECFKLKAKAAQDKLNLVYKALCPILGGNSTEQDIEQIVTQRFKFPLHLGSAPPGNGLKRNSLATKTPAAGIGTTTAEKKVILPNGKTAEVVSHQIGIGDGTLSGKCIPSDKDVERVSVLSSKVAQGVVSDDKAEEESFLCIADGTDEILKEVLDLSSVEMESQFVSDVETPGIINETPIKKGSWNRSLVAERVIREILGPSQPPRNVLVPETPPELMPQPFDTDRPQLIVPETEPQVYNETTPKKSLSSPPDQPISLSRCRNGLSGRDLRDSGDVENEVKTPDALSGSSVRVKGFGKMVQGHCVLISPSSSRLDPMLGLSPGTPKRKRTPHKKTHSPHRTPRKRYAPLTKGHRIDAEVTFAGVQRTTQTKLNKLYFKKPTPQHQLKVELNVLETPSPAKGEEDDVILESPGARGKFQRHSPPLADIGNCPELDETLLSLSAMRKVASDVLRQVIIKRDVACSYDNVPEVDNEEGIKRRDVLKKLPGLECPECEKFYELMADGQTERKQEILNQCSRHRIVKPVTSLTPPGFWKPMLSPTLSPDASMKY